MKQPLKVGLIYGSARHGRFCDTVARWTEKELGASGKFSVEVIDPMAHSRAARNEATAHDATTHPASNYRSLRTQLGEPDAFVVVTPEYNHGYPAALKELIDSAGEEWYAKPVAFVSYGGVSGGLRAVEQLRQVFAELNVVSIRESISFQNAWQLFDATGCPAEPNGARLKCRECSPSSTGGPSPSAPPAKPRHIQPPLRHGIRLKRHKIMASTARACHGDFLKRRFSKGPPV
jgi:NAD(P)H-dependent FMN reductase